MLITQQILYRLLLCTVARSSGIGALLPGKTGLFFRERITIQKLPVFKEKPIWIHTASTGEYEQAEPLVKAIKKEFPHIPVVVSFFSPSGMLAKRGKTHADAEIYMPVDCPSDAKRFIEKLNPRMAIFIKYEFWPEHLRILAKKNIPVFSASSVFRENNAVFKYAYLRNSLRYFEAFFVQDEKSKKILNSHGFRQVFVSGDTRFDSVAGLPSESVKFPILEDFGNQAKLIIAGSTWPEDEKLLLRFMKNHAPENVKLVLIPHEPTPQHVRSLTQSIKLPYARYSTYGKNDSQAKILIGDVTGLLKYIYRYGIFAYIGGGFGRGIHNILEANTYGLPVIFGPRYRKFIEAVTLIEKGGAVSIRNEEELNRSFLLWLDPEKRNAAASIVRSFVQSNTGASERILKHLKKFVS